MVSTNAGSSGVIRIGKPHQTLPAAQILVFLVRHSNETSTTAGEYSQMVPLMRGVLLLSSPCILAIACFMCNKKNDHNIMQWEAVLGATASQSFNIPVWSAANDGTTGRRFEIPRNPYQWLGIAVIDLPLWKVPGTAVSLVVFLA